MSAARILVEEYLAAMRRMSWADAEALAAAVGWKAIKLVCPAPTGIRVEGAGDRYQPDDDGAPAWVLPVTCVDPDMPDLIEAPSPLELVSAGPVIDLMALHPAAPERWALRRGAAAVLGIVDIQSWEPEPVPVHRTPIAWLRSGCTGLVLLTGDAQERARLLRQIAVIAAADAMHAAELRRLLALPPPIHTRVVTGERGNGNAMGRVADQSLPAKPGRRRGRDRPFGGAAADRL